jgi:integrase
MYVLDVAGVAKLLSASRGSEFEAPVAIAIASGLRRGELLGLRWSDIDFKAERLSVRRSLERVNGVLRTKEPKTAKSRRTVALPAFALDVLRGQRAAQNERRLLCGLGRDEDGWVFDRGDGEGAIEPGGFSLRFARLAKRAKVRVRFHDLRHSYATLMLASGVDLKTISLALGHSAIATTGNLYLHSVESLQADAAARFDSMLGRTVSEALAADTGPQRAHAGKQITRKANKIRRFVVAPTGIEPVFPP